MPPATPVLSPEIMTRAAGPRAFWATEAIDSWTTTTPPASIGNNITHFKIRSPSRRVQTGALFSNSFLGNLPPVTPLISEPAVDHVVQGLAAQEPAEVSFQ